MMPDTIIAGGGTPETDWDGALTQLEERAEIDSLDDLQARRRQLLPEYSALRALHGSNGKWDAKRKALLEALKVRARMDATKRGEKVTEGLIDALAHADEQYIAFVDSGIDGATRYVVLETEITEIEEKVRNREFCLTAWSRELALR